MVEGIDFGGLRIAFDERVLRPRPWTLEQSRWGAELMRTAPPGPVLELCTGAGQIGLASIVDNDRRLVCVDADSAAVEFCRANAAAAGLADRVEVRLGALESALGPGERFAVVIADPPWVPAAGTSVFPNDPLSAIDGGEDGLDVARSCIAVIAEHLAPGGTAVLQLGSIEQADALTSDGVRVLDRRSCEGGVLVLLEGGPSA